MQDLIQKSVQAESFSANEHFRILKNNLTLSDSKNCLNWKVKVPDWLIDHFYRHELYNDKYISIGIDPVPFTKLPFYQRLRPYLL